MTTAVSVDLDDLDCYYAVHGVSGPPRQLALRRWLPRFLELFAALKVRATFFVIGRDLDVELGSNGEGAQYLRDALAAGHELASHSYAHDYAMASWDAERIQSDLERVDGLLRSLGTTPRGFRAPGYSHGEGLLRAVANAGYRYDSSALPAPAYYAGKLGVMALMALRGRRSDSTLRHVRTFLGTTAPHVRTDVPLVELPMSVSPVMRLPLIGTTLLGGPDWLRRRLRRSAVTAPLLNLELHAIDLADANLDAIEPGLPELDVPFALRAARLRTLLSARRGPFITLAELAETV